MAIKNAKNWKKWEIKENFAKLRKKCVLLFLLGWNDCKQNNR